MKAKLFAVMTAVLVLCSVVSAQGYSIRVTYNTNLRAAASLSGRIVETASSGTALQVVGNADRWLKINRNGSEVWMADWVGYTRVEGSAQTPSQVASNIDNCCFVDRICTSNQEWRDGYWAFQNNQCAAPASSPQQTLSQPVSSSPAQIDNCCFVDRQCNTDSEWTSGYWAYQNNQCAATAQSPAPNLAGCATPVHHAATKLTLPIVEGPDRFVRRVNNVLNWLKRRAPEWYTFVVTGADLIGQSSVYGRSYAKGGSRNMYIDPTSAFRGEGIPDDYIILASVLAHEACHIHDGDAGVVREGWEGEIRAERKELEVLEALDPYARYESIDYLKRGAILTIISMERGWLASQLNRGN